MRWLGLLFLVSVELACKSSPKADNGAPSPSAPTASSAAPAASTARAISPIREVEDGILPGQIVTGVDLRVSLAKRMDHYGVRAVGVAVIDGGRVQWAHTWGAGMDDETVFQAASVSKPVTAVAVLRLVEQGKLELDADVRTYLRSWTLPEPTRKVTLRQLLSHTAGLSAPEQRVYSSIDGGYAHGEALPTTAEILKGAKPAKNIAVEFLPTPPGTFVYSGGGYMVVQQILEDVTGKSFADALQSLVFTPLGMKHSTFDVLPPTANAAHAFGPGGAPRKGGWIVVPEKAPGGLWTTPSDLALFLADLMAAGRGEDGHLLKPTTFKQMLTPIADARPLVQGSIGLGMFVLGEKDDLYFKHDGHNPGFWTTMMAVPARSKGLIIMINREDAIGIVNEVGFAIGTLYDFPPSTGTRPRKRDLVGIAPDVLAGHAGTYEGGGLRVVARVDGDKLSARVGEAPEATYYPISKTDFLDPWAPALLSFGEKAIISDSPAGKGEVVRVSP